MQKVNEGKIPERSRHDRFRRRSPILQRIPILAAANVLAWSGVSNSLVFASCPQSQIEPHRALEHAEKAIEEAEKFDASYGKAVGSLNDYAIQDLDSKRKGLRKALTTANTDLDGYLRTHPKDVDALLLQVRFDLAKYWVFWPEGQSNRKGVPGGERNPEKTVDLILQIEPGNAEAYYRKAQLSVSARSRNEPDFSVALGYARMAVEYAPQNATYRELLATYLYSEGKVTEAAEAVKSLQGGTHPMYRLLLDQAQTSVPDGAIFDFQATSLASMLAPDDYAYLRTRAFFYLGPASKVEEFYRKLWPDFHFQADPGGGYDYDPDTKTTLPANGGVAIFRWRNGLLTFSPEEFPRGFMEGPAGQSAGKSPLKGALTLWVSESPNLKKGFGGTIWERLPANFSGERACTIEWINFRAFDENRSSPSPVN